MDISFCSMGFILSDETLLLIIRDAEKLINDAPISCEEVRYQAQKMLDERDKN